MGDRPQRHWSAAVYTRANPLMRRILSSRWHGPVSRRTVLLGITGRRSGQHYEICVGYAPNGTDTIDVLISDASNRQWWRNFVDGGPVRVVLRGRALSGWATAHRAPSAEFKEIFDRAIPDLLGRSGARRFFALDDFDAATGLSPEDLDFLDGFAAAVTIQLATVEAGRP
jgi:hypothetical protein